MENPSSQFTTNNHLFFHDLPQLLPSLKSLLTKSWLLKETELHRCMVLVQFFFLEALYDIAVWLKGHTLMTIMMDVSPR